MRQNLKNRTDPKRMNSSVYTLSGIFSDMYHENTVKHLQYIFFLKHGNDLF